MEDMNTRLTEAERQQQVYERAMASLKTDQMKLERNGYAVMSSALGYGEGSTGTGPFGKISKAAQIFCIAFLCAVPPFLAWYVLF